MSTTSRWSRRTTNPVTAAIKVVTGIIVGILVLGILLTWTDANRGNDIVDLVLDWGEWLATPLDDVFTPADPKHMLYENWALAAVVYWALGSLLAWLARW